MAVATTTTEEYAEADDREPTPEEQEIIDLVEDTWSRYRHRRQGLERMWYRNILFYIGLQWIRWDLDSKGFRKRNPPTWVPTPATNRFAATLNRIAAILSRVIPNWAYVPATDELNDVLSADMAEKIEPVICEETRVDDAREKVAMWMATTGNAFLLGWVEEKVRPEPDVEELFQQALDAGVTAEQLAAEPQLLTEFMPKPSYCLYNEVYSPFEVYGNLSVEDIEDQERILLVRRRDCAWVQRQYKIKVEPDNAPEDLGLHYLEAIGYTTPDGGFLEHSNMGEEALPRVTVKRLIMRPTEKYPDGLYVVVANKKILEQTTLAKTAEGDHLFNLIHFKFDRVPGAFYARTPMDDLVQKQAQRNRLESMIELIVIRMGSPIWLVPEGTVVKNWNVGEPGTMLKYSLIGDKSTAPAKIEGSQIPASIIGLLNKIDQDFEELASTFEAMKGEAPYSGVPGIVVQQLIDQGYSRFGQTFRQIGEGWRKWMKLMLELFRLYANEDRILRIIGNNGKWKIQRFSNADFNGGVDVRVESDSLQPRNEQVEAAKMLAAWEGGLADQFDPLVRYEILSKLHLTDLAKSLKEDITDATRENERMSQGEQVPVRPFIDNHVLHIQKHKSFLLSEDGNDPFIQEVVMHHILEHIMFMDAESTPGTQGGGEEEGAEGPSPGETEGEVLAPDSGADEVVNAAA